MAKVRQLPKLYLRGALAKITMSNLTETQKKHVNTVTDYISRHDTMQPHKGLVMKKLSVTIGGDYLEDRMSAEQEYQIAIWRGVVNLFYHRKYTFECAACGRSHYITKRSKPKSIDRIQMPCPNCLMVTVDNPGEVQSLKTGQHLTMDDFQASYADMPDGFNAPTAKSSIFYIAGDARYEDPQKIVDDPTQMQKFFGEFVWNYFRQHLKENPRESNRNEQKMVDTADRVILHDILSLCFKMGIEHTFCERTCFDDNKYTIQICGLLTPPEFTAELGIIKLKAVTNEVKIEIDNAGISVYVSTNAKQITTTTFRPTHVSVVDNSAGNDANVEQSVARISYRTVGRNQVKQEDHIETFDVNEAHVLVRESLPVGHCRDIFDIFSQQGEIYVKFQETYSDDGKAKINQIATFLGITPRMVNNYRDVIKMNCLANDFIPVD